MRVFVAGGTGVLGRRLVPVQGVTAGGPADKAGLRPGDVIVEVDGEPMHDADTLIAKTLQMKAGDVIRLTYERLGASHTTALRLSAG